MTTQFEVRFTRWNRQRGVRETSGPVFVNAEDFTDAFREAAQVLQGMKYVTPTLASAGRRFPAVDYEIAEIKHIGLGGPRGESTLDIWEMPLDKEDKKTWFATSDIEVRDEFLTKKEAEEALQAATKSNGVNKSVWTATIVDNAFIGRHKAGNNMTTHYVARR